MQNYELIPNGRFSREALFELMFGITRHTLVEYPAVCFGVRDTQRNIVDVQLVAYEVITHLEPRKMLITGKVVFPDLGGSRVEKQATISIDFNTGSGKLSVA